MNKYEVGYIADDSPMGIYYNETEEAIQECKYDVQAASLHGYKSPLSARERLQGMVAYRVYY